MALRAARRPLCAHADLKTSSNSGVQWQVLPRGLPNFWPFIGTARFQTARFASWSKPHCHLRLLPNTNLSLGTPTQTQIAAIQLRAKVGSKTDEISFPLARGRLLVNEM